MNKIGMIYQPCGLGDILFLQKMAYTMIEEGYEVYWPVVHELIRIENYISDFNFVSWADVDNRLTRPPLPKSVTFPRIEEYLPETVTKKTTDFYFFQGFSNHNPIMAGKYDSVGMEWRDWRDWIRFKRNEEKEKELFYDVLKLKDDDEYVLVGNKYGTRPKVYHYQIPQQDIDLKGRKLVTIDILSDFFIFDWCKVFEHASEIRMIETSFNYMLESPQMFDIMSKKELHLYSRRNDFGHVDYLFNLPWRYHT